MDIKLAFLTITAVVLTYNTDIGTGNGENVDEYSAVACQKFPVKQKELYHFVTFPGIVDKWLHWITLFAEADHKPLGIGKMYKAVIKNFKMFFNVTKFQDGHLIVLESNFVFRPRVEVTFWEHHDNATDCECLCKPKDTSKLVIKLFFRRTSILFQYTLGVIFRAIFEHLLRESVQNLSGILSNSTSCPNIFIHI